MSNRKTNDASCLFLTQYRLIRAPCSFEVVTRYTTLKWNKGEKFKVERVIDWDGSTLLFKIQGSYYYHSFFEYTLPSIQVIWGLKK